MDLWHFLGDLHPRLGHFPHVLLLAGLLFDAVGLVVRSAPCHWAAKILTSAGTVLLIVVSDNLRFFDHVHPVPQPARWLHSW
ncbi:MAG TPA: hypothetical protein VGI81_28105 [Tepidisphaeraceae bacterium]|jgi:uncharacterized membrane protein